MISVSDATHVRDVSPPLWFADVRLTWTSGQPIREQLLESWRHGWQQPSTASLASDHVSCHRHWAHAVPQIDGTSLYWFRTGCDSSLSPSVGADGGGRGHALRLRLQRLLRLSAAAGGQHEVIPGTPGRAREPAAHLQVATPLTWNHVTQNNFVTFWCTWILKWVFI